MNRRTFLKLVPQYLVSISALSLLTSHKKSWAEDLDEEWLRGLKIWSYYVPLLSYSGILEEFTGKNPLDRKVIYEEVIKKTDRINGKETDGTKNTATFEISDLEKATEYIRVHFWHDDNGGSSGHTLFIFKRYLEDLENGKKIFVATGMTGGHFHVVMIQPPAEF